MSGEHGVDQEPAKERQEERYAYELAGNEDRNRERAGGGHQQERWKQIEV